MSRRRSVYPFIDLFAGPGGLGEGFSEFGKEESKSVFESIASIEDDEFAHQTLVLRHFYHSFDRSNVPFEYYDYIQSNIPRSELVTRFRTNWQNAESSALRISLGRKSHGMTKKLLKSRLKGVSKWVLIGGPPCQAYSIAGRSRMTSKPDFEDDDRHFLYREYLKILVDHKPPVFVMENVKGLLSSRVKGEPIIDKITQDLANPGVSTGKRNSRLKYRLYSLTSSNEVKGDVDPRTFIVKSERHGIPQARHRMFILGVRSDKKVSPGILSENEPPTVEQIIGSMPKIRSGISGKKDSLEQWRKVLSSVNHRNWLLNGCAQDLSIGRTIEKAIREINNSDLRVLSRTYNPPNTMRGWYYDSNLSSCSSHEARSHMQSDLHRYLFVASYGEVFNVSPKLSVFPVDLLPSHKNVHLGCTGSMFSDRFRVQLRSKVSTTITSHISKDGHYYIHYDPAQCRSLSVREAARLQTFPDNFFFEGPRTAKFHQVGNAVPPYLAYQIAEVVCDILDSIPE